MQTESQSTTPHAWHALDVSEVARILNTDAAEGLAGADARQRLDKLEPDFTPLAEGLTLCSDATVSDEGEVVGDPTEAALVVLAAKMVLTDDNFSTLVHAIELGRDVYGKITAQIRYVMAGLFGVLFLMVLASLFGINDGNVLSPVQLLFVTFFIGIFPAIGISIDSSEPGIMDLPPRDPDETILNRRTTPRWFVFGLVQALIKTTSLSGQQWASVVVLALVPSMVIEAEKALRAYRQAARLPAHELQRQPT